VADGPSIKAYCNCDDAYVVWRYPERIKDCRGFALWRDVTNDGKAELEPVSTWVGWAKDDPPESGHHESSETWPIQRYMWSDFLVRPGQTVRYQVVPMIGVAADLHSDREQATPWSEMVSIDGTADEGLAAWFNRGVLATQALVRRLSDAEPWKTQLTKIMATRGDKTRDWLSGELRLAMLALLAEIEATPAARLRAALFELDDPDLQDALLRLKDRAEVVLANGTHKDGADENGEARDRLEAGGVNVYPRRVKQGLAHNKFLVCLDPSGKARQVWTGSTNWTQTGLCTQVNNGLLVTSDALADVYDKQWEQLRHAADDGPKTLRAKNAKALPDPPVAVGAARASVWFTATDSLIDLTAARNRINQAMQGFLILMFYPGKTGTLLNAIDDLVDANPKLYVHRVVNQDPEAPRKNDPHPDPPR
jgi:hypothetical protein